MLLLDILKRQNAEKADIIATLTGQVEREQILRAQERRAAESLHTALRNDIEKTRASWGLGGLVFGVGIGLAIK